MNELTLAGTLVIIIMGICQAVKYTQFPVRYIPLLAIVLGIGFSIYADGANWMATLAGVILGLVSSGLYSGIKKTIFNK